MKEVVQYTVLGAIVLIFGVWVFSGSIMQLDKLFCEDSIVQAGDNVAVTTCDYGAKLEVTPKGQFICRCDHSKSRTFGAP